MSVGLDEVGGRGDSARAHEEVPRGYRRALPLANWSVFLVDIRRLREAEASCLAFGREIGRSTSEGEGSPKRRSWRRVGWEGLGHEGRVWRKQGANLVEGKREVMGLLEIGERTSCFEDFGLRRERGLSASFSVGLS